MKTLIQIFFLLFVLILSGNTQAQIQKGSFRIGGTASYSSGKFTNDSRFRQLSLSPAVAYFPIARLSVGLSNTTSFSSSDQTNYDYSSTNYSFGPELRYYFPFGKWAVFPEVLYAFGKTTSESTSSDFMGDPLLYKYESSFNTFRGGVGLTYFVNPNIGLEGILFYQNATQEAFSPFSSPSESKSINFRIGFQIYLNRN